MAANVSILPPPITVLSNQSILRAHAKGTMVLTITTAPSVGCMLVLGYGFAKPAKHLLARSDTTGRASWTWHVEAHAPPGTWQLLVTVTLRDGEQVSAPVMVTVW